MCGALSSERNECESNKDLKERTKQLAAEILEFVERFRSAFRTPNSAFPGEIMRIKTQFIITMLLFGIVLVVIAASAIITSQRVERAGEQERIAANIAQGASELSYLANDYLIYLESQQLSRWKSRFASFSRQVGALDAEKHEQQALVRNIQANQQRLKEVFDSVVSGVGNSFPNQRSHLDPAFLQVSWSRMAVQSQGSSPMPPVYRGCCIKRWTGSGKLGSVLRFNDRLVRALLLSGYMLTYRRILRSMATLMAGAEVIGSGRLDFRIDEKKNDEIGDLSRAFNRMTADLKTVTASKAELEREVAERKRAEEELRRQREWLQVTLTSIGDAVIATDAGAKISFLNPVAATLTGGRARKRLAGLFRTSSASSMKRRASRARTSSVACCAKGATSPWPIIRP